jgi:Zn-dependent protease
MFTQVELGRIAGIPIVLDMMFVLLLILFSYPYFTNGDSQMMSAGLVIIAGIVLSILLHELGHAFAGRLLGIGVTHITLTGLGGIAHFERSLPNSAVSRTIIYLAGPVINLFLWLGLDALLGQDVALANPMLSLAIAVLSSANFYLLCFNVLPAYPLDGGNTLDAWLGKLMWPGTGVRVVATLGLLISGYLAITALPMNFWRLLLAMFLFQVNWNVLQRAGGWSGR